jgi:hypothetical protein
MFSCREAMSATIVVGGHIAQVFHTLIMSAPQVGKPTDPLFRLR